MNPILERLSGTDRRSIGKSNQVVTEVLAQPTLFASLFEGMLSNDPVIRMRAADAVEKITVVRPEYLRPFKAKLLRNIARINQQEVRWHMAQMFSRLDLTPGERHIVFGILLEYLKDRSSIVKTFSMQALADIAEQDDNLRGEIIQRLRRLTRTGSASMRSRGTKLLVALSERRRPVQSSARRLSAR